MSDPVFVEELLGLLREAFEGGRPGEGTGFVENTPADGSRNGGLSALLDSVSAAEASAPTALGTSIAAHAAHVAFHLEVGLRWAEGERGPFDWQGSFEPRTVDEAAWTARRARVHAAYEATVALARRQPAWDDDDDDGLAAALAHAAYHLGAMRQIAKLARRG